MTDGENIECTVTKWYHKRMWLLFAMVLGFALWFLYDATIGYPKKAGIYKEYQEMVDAGKEKEWEKKALAEGLPSAPDEVKESNIQQQWHFTIGLAVCSFLVLLTFFLNKGKKLTADASGFITPGGKRVPFDGVFRIDRRKWDHKGLAYVYYKEDGDGAKKKAIIDDLKFGGADKILSRLMDNFEGELIDRVPDEEEEPSSEESESEEGASDEKSSN